MAATGETSPSKAPSRAVSEVVDLVSALIRFDTSNTGDLATTKGERECAQWVADQLHQAGYTTEYVEEDIRSRAFAALKAGKNTLAIHCHDNAGGQYIHVGLEKLGD